MSITEIGQYQGIPTNGLAQALRPPLGYDQQGPSQPRPPLLDEVTLTRAELSQLAECFNKACADFDQRLHRIECVLGIQR